MEADTSQLDFALEGALRDMGVSQRFAIRDVMRVMVNNMILLSFPKSRTEGKKAIDTDLEKVFNGLDSPEVLAYFNNRFGDGSATQAGKLKGKKRKSTVNREIPNVKFNWSGDKSRMKGWHESHRRKGKVRFKSTLAETAGKFKFYSGMYVPTSRLRSYARDVYKSIGKYKAGWVPAANWLARVTGGRNATPAFAQKQPDKRGSYGEWKDGTGLGGVWVSNKVNYASRMGAYIIERARLKTVAYSQKATKKQAESIAARFNAQRTAGATA